MNIESWILLFGMGAILWVLGVLTVSVLAYIDTRTHLRHKERINNQFVQALNNTKDKT